MARTYTMKRRAAGQAETRQRIVEAAVELHCTVGPSQTTVSMIAERAGVQRHTFYAHFPDDRSLWMACSNLFFERDPMPDAAPWPAIVDVSVRLRTALTELYVWYARNADSVATIQRDAERHALTREVNTLRVAPVFGAYHATLGAGLNAKQRAMLPLALNFHTWRTLALESGMSPDAAADAMTRSVLSFAN